MSTASHNAWNETITNCICYLKYHNTKTKYAILTGENTQLTVKTNKTNFEASIAAAFSSVMFVYH